MFDSYDDQAFAAKAGWPAYKEKIAKITRRQFGRPPRTPLRRAIERARDAIKHLQHEEGYWCFELEADCTIPAEYILMMHFMDDIDGALEAKLAVYIRERQLPNGGWPLYHGGRFDLSCSVKAYYALKLAGDDVKAPHMRRARALIIAHGGAARCNVFTRMTLAFFGQVPWRAIPYLPVEIVLLPRWFPFHLNKISYWSRTVMVPLAILCTLRARAVNPRKVGVSELFTVPAREERRYFPVRSKTNLMFLLLERHVRRLDPVIPNRMRKQALKRAEQWFIERLNGEHGLGAIFPAMVNAHQALAMLGYDENHPHRRTTKKALEKLLVVNGRDAYCQPCVSPIWDTALAALAVHEAEGATATAETGRALAWLVERQITHDIGDWKDYRPALSNGGWPFQFANPHYPDLDDTAVVAWALHHVDAAAHRETISRAAEWIGGMQSRQGGFAAFDADNTYFLLNEIPFADHGALLDPPTADVTARCVTLLARLGDEKYQDTVLKALDFLMAEQEEHGAWFGRWGTNYIYGTWSVLVALEHAGIPATHPVIRRAAEWVKNSQREDGGWGESNDSYHSPEIAGTAENSTAFQTAWALLALMAAGEIHSAEVQAGVNYLLRTQNEQGLWQDAEFTAPGFPRVFYLKYHGYDKYFPLWALARYFNLTQPATGV